MSDPVIVYAAVPNHRGDPELDVYGPFDTRELAEGFRDRLNDYYLFDRCGRVDIYLSGEFEIQSPESHLINDPEYLDDKGVG